MSPDAWRLTAQKLPMSAANMLYRAMGMQHETLRIEKLAALRIELFYIVARLVQWKLRFEKVFLM